MLQVCDVCNSPSLCATLHRQLRQPSILPEYIGCHQVAVSVRFGHTALKCTPLQKWTALLPAGLEEALIASLADAEGANPSAGAPPASKHAVKSLVREKLSEERLQQLGGAGTQCAVCRSAPLLLPCLLLTTRYNSSVFMCMPSVHAHPTSS